MINPLFILNIILLLLLLTLFTIQIIVGSQPPFNFQFLFPTNTLQRRSSLIVFIPNSKKSSRNQWLILHPCSFFLPVLLISFYSFIDLPLKRQQSFSECFSSYQQVSSIQMNKKTKQFETSIPSLCLSINSIILSTSTSRFVVPSLFCLLLDESFVFLTKTVHHSIPIWFTTASDRTTVTHSSNQTISLFPLLSCLSAVLRSLFFISINVSPLWGLQSQYIISLRKNRNSDSMPVGRLWTIDSLYSFLSSIDE